MLQSQPTASWVRE